MLVRIGVGAIATGCQFFPILGTNRFVSRSPFQAKAEWLRWALAISSHACRWWQFSHLR